MGMEFLEYQSTKYSLVANNSTHYIYLHTVSYTLICYSLTLLMPDNYRGKDNVDRSQENKELMLHYLLSTTTFN